MHATLALLTVCAARLRRVISECAVPSGETKTPDGTHVTQEYVHAVVFLFLGPFSFRYLILSSAVEFRFYLLAVLQLCRMAHVTPVAIPAASVNEDPDGDPQASAPPLLAAEVRVQLSTLIDTG